jgi:hypothetical protein
MWTVNATRVATRDEWTYTRQVPTFSLDENILGIVRPLQAAAIARDIMGIADDEVAHMTIMSPDLKVTFFVATATVTQPEPSRA